MCPLKGKYTADDINVNKNDFSVSLKRTRHGLPDAMYPLMYQVTCTFLVALYCTVTFLSVTSCVTEIHCGFTYTGVFRENVENITFILKTQINKDIYQIQSSVVRLCVPGSHFATGSVPFKSKTILEPKPNFNHNLTLILILTIRGF